MTMAGYWVPVSLHGHRLASSIVGFHGVGLIMIPRNLLGLLFYLVF